MTQQTCPGCGHAVRVYSGDEGTSSYEPVGCASLLAALEQALVDHDARVSNAGEEGLCPDDAWCREAREAIRVARGTQETE